MLERPLRDLHERPQGAPCLVWRDLRDVRDRFPVRGISIARVCVFFFYFFYLINRSLRSLRSLYSIFFNVILKRDLCLSERPRSLQPHGATP